jgi:nicotinamidase-related amidase
VGEVWTGRSLGSSTNAIDESAVIEHSALPDWVEFLLQGRPDRVTAAMLAGESPEVRRVAREAQEGLAAMALALEPVAPSAALRDRILASVGDRLRIAQKRTALLVIDMLNDHLTPGGSLEVPRARDVVPALRARLEAARAAGVPVVYVCDEHDPDDPDLDEWTTHNVRGTAGAEVWPAIAPQPGDRTVHKHTYSAFTGSNLQAVLDELRVDTLVVTGCLTEIGLLATATDALQRGFAVEVPPDSQAGASPLAEQAALGMLSVMPPYGAARRERLALLHV